MNNKNYQYKQTFTFKDLNGSDVNIYCYSNFGSQYSNSEYAVIYLDNGSRVAARYTYINRPWYRFKYETAIRSLINKVYHKKADADLKAYLLAQLKDYGEAESRAADAWFNAFKARYEKLDPKVKESLKNADVELVSVDHAEAVMTAAEMLSAIK